MDSDVVIQTQHVDTLYTRIPGPVHRNIAEPTALFATLLDEDPH